MLQSLFIIVYTKKVCVVNILRNSLNAFIVSWSIGLEIFFSHYATPNIHQKPYVLHVRGVFHFLMTVTGYGT